ncbi:hypothetical protein [Streptomyces virginiae]|uniref:hypothetical protein n=1 Tax=Streptomyces virginiae TaxID=1961 RepID=UPI00225496EB|nr:hypothetical protein [Streptomyces virginiae]MCX4715436.1 hypothetical protein [Streptomyces virginiae]MCX5273180.1 hypothetical protein [Streptomyces virginiae]
MRNTVVRRTVLTASAVSLALLATACGSDKKDDTKADAKPSGASSSAPAAAAAKAKTDAELSALLLTKDELTDHLVVAVPKDEVAIGEAAKGDKAECRPVVRTQGTATVGTAAGVARMKAVAKPKAGANPEDTAAAGFKALAGTRTSVTLASYEGKGAEEAFAAVKSAATACAGGFTLTMEGEDTKIDKVVSSAATGGDEAIALTLEAAVEGNKVTTETVIVRKGNVLATHTASALGVAEKPTAIVAAQVKKLG